MMIKYLLFALMIVTTLGVILQKKCLENGEKCGNNITLCCQICYENTICIDSKLNN